MSGVVGAWLPPAEDEQLLQQLAPMLRALQQRGVAASATGPTPRPASRWAIAGRRPIRRCSR
jgi:hypothetical protein